MHATAQKTKTIQVKVAFPMSTRGPYHHRYDEADTIARVRFRVHEEPGSVYYLTEDRRDDRRVEDGETLGELVEHKHELKLTLVKDLIQG
jgi:hypothetical protein